PSDARAQTPIAVHPASSCGHSPLPFDRRCYVFDGVEVVSVHLVRLECHAKLRLQKRDELDRGDRVQNSARYERRVVPQFVRILAGQKLAQYVLFDGRLDLWSVHRDDSGLWALRTDLTTSLGKADKFWMLDQLLVETVGHESMRSGVRMVVPRSHGDRSYRLTGVRAVEADRLEAGDTRTPLKIVELFRRGLQMGEGHEAPEGHHPATARRLCNMAVRPVEQLIAERL